MKRRTPRRLPAIAQFRKRPFDRDDFRAKLLIGRPTSQDQFYLAVSDVGIAYHDTLASDFNDGDTDQSEKVVLISHLLTFYTSCASVA
jgi:hypothetical protein